MTSAFHLKNWPIRGVNRQRTANASFFKSNEFKSDVPQFVDFQFPSRVSTTFISLFISFVLRNTHEATQRTTGVILEKATAAHQFRSVLWLRSLLESCCRRAESLQHRCAWHDERTEWKQVYACDSRKCNERDWRRGLRYRIAAGRAAAALRRGSGSGPWQWFRCVDVMN